MPYVRRDENNKITSIYNFENADATEWVNAGDPELVSILGTEQEKDEFATLDVTFIRVIEDVVDVLIQKGVLCLTDLPAKAQEKLMARRSFRDRRNENSLRLINDDELI